MNLKKNQSGVAMIESLGLENAKYVLGNDTLVGLVAGVLNVIAVAGLDATVKDKRLSFCGRRKKAAALLDNDGNLQKMSMKGLLREIVRGSAPVLRRMFDVSRDSAWTVAALRLLGGACLFVDGGVWRPVAAMVWRGCNGRCVALRRRCENEGKAIGGQRVRYGVVCGGSGAAGKAPAASKSATRRPTAKAKARQRAKGATGNAPSATAEVMRLCVNNHSWVNAPTQFAGIAALEGPQDAVQEMVAAFDLRRTRMVALLNDMPGVSCVMPKGAFYAFPNITGTGLDSATMQDRLLQETGVAAIAGTSFGRFGEGYLRFGCASCIDNMEEAMARMEGWLADNAGAK